MHPNNLFFNTISCFSLRMHDAGEMDVRACYTAISVSLSLSLFLSLQVYVASSLEFNFKPNQEEDFHSVYCSLGMYIGSCIRAQ